MEWMDVDENVPTVHHYTDSEIVDMVTNPEKMSVLVVIKIKVVTKMRKM